MTYDTAQPRCRFLILPCLALPIAMHTAAAQGVPPPPSERRAAEQPPPPVLEPRMPEDVRIAVDSVVIITGRRPAGQDVGGTYDKDTDGLLDGMAKGREIGRIHKQVGPVPVNIPIPILEIPGAIFGGLSGATKRQIQEFRDALTEELAGAENTTIKDDGLALDVFWGLRKLPDLDSKLFSPRVEVPEDTDAVLYVSFDDIGINVQGKEAVLTTAAEATLRRYSDGVDLYETKIYYQDRDTLRNWTDNDNALWRDYANYARHYLGRELAADLFDRVYLPHDLHPLATRTAEPDKKEAWRYVSRSATPELAWEFSLEDVPGTQTIDAGTIRYNVEIYDRNRLVYEGQAAEKAHTVAMELECGKYRWSVRPSFQLDGATRFGEWMRREPETKELKPSFKGIVGRQASASPAYSQDFAVLDIPCRK